MRDMFGIEYTPQEADAMSNVWVCTEHMVFLPCRACDSDSRIIMLPHSCDDKDVEEVRRYQLGVHRRRGSRSGRSSR